MRLIDGRTDPRAVAALTGRLHQQQEDVEARVREILQAVRADGEEAVTTYTRELDCRFIDSLGLRVAEKDVQAAYRAVSPRFLVALRSARRNISAFHRKQKPASWTLRSNGARLTQRYAPLDRVGIYVPGGKAAYPSTVMMNAVPAAIAGVKEIAMVTPCNREGKILPEVLVAAAECGVREIYRIGGAQAIGALAYGTESIRRVDKITGPGNAYVAAAKKMVFGTVGIDMIAGPTEVVILADETANPVFVAADLIAQAEHDELAWPVLVTTSPRLAERVMREVEIQLEQAERRAVAARSLADHGVAVVVRNRAAALELVNELAPEHLEVILRRPHEAVRRVRHAGSIFVGHWSAEALGDYIAGPNHTLPTVGTARFSSPLGVLDFLKFTNVIEYSKEGMRRVALHAEALAEAEGLFGHAASVRMRRLTR
jgi:histidinol dehydrogenase